MVLGATALGLVACGGGDSAKPTPTGTSAATAATETAPAPTSTPTIVPTPTATPTPYNGAVARFKFPKLNVDAPVEALGVNARGELDTPHSGHENTDVGWYDQSLVKDYGVGAKPGWGSNAFFSAHVYYISSKVCPNNPMACPAPFQKLTQAAVGDDIYIDMDDGTEYHYTVISRNRYTRDNVPMGALINPPERPAGKEWITMMTCGGTLDSTGLEYLSRDVVVAERVT
jgi:hypothetical protein